MTPARILTLDECLKERADWGSVVLSSGGFDPVHPGHISYLLHAATLAQTHVVIVNGDGFLARKKGKAFQSLTDRVAIVAAMRGVDVVVPYEGDERGTVEEPIRLLRPQVFAKGGDRFDKKTIPEWELSKLLRIQVKNGVGRPKKWSSSHLLAQW